MVLPHRKLGPEMRTLLGATASLDVDDRERLARWFSTWMNALGQTRRAAGMRINPGARRSVKGAAAEQAPDVFATLDVRAHAVLHATRPCTPPTFLRRLSDALRMAQRPVPALAHIAAHKSCPR
jgi:hypothetical protein